jgi:hypothetical protein
VRLVLSQDKISVFAVMAPPAVPQPRSSAGGLPWLAGLALAAGALAAVVALVRGRTSNLAPRPAQGRLLAALRQARLAPDVEANHHRQP